MKTGTKVIIGVAALAAVAGVIYFMNRKPAAIVVKTAVLPGQTALQQDTAAANTAVTAANALTNLVNSVSDAASSDNGSDDTVDYSTSDSTLTGVSLAWGAN